MVEVDLLEQLFPVHAWMAHGAHIPAVESSYANLGQSAVVMSPRLGVKADNHHAVGQRQVGLQLFQPKAVLKDLLSRRRVECRP